MGIEILEQVPDVDVVLVPVGGAGLIAGMFDSLDQRINKNFIDDICDHEVVLGGIDAILCLWIE